MKRTRSPAKLTHQQLVERFDDAIRSLTYPCEIAAEALPIPPLSDDQATQACRHLATAKSFLGDLQKRIMEAVTEVAQ